MEHTHSMASVWVVTIHRVENGVPEFPLGVSLVALIESTETREERSELAWGER